MLVASRDPFHSGPHNPDTGAHIPSPHGPAPRLARAMSVLQIAGTLLAIPVGIGSAYSMYRANFSVDTTCQNLRANIISIIDKKIDARTRHMLVRRDVETFEKTCVGFDPDAEAAFKGLLATDKTPAAVAAVAAAPRTDAPAKAAVRKVEPHSAVAAKQPPANAAPIAAVVEPVRHEAAVPDDKWLGAVRDALVAHEPEQAAPEKTEEPAIAKLTPAAPREMQAAKPPEAQAAKPPEAQASKPREEAAKPPEAQAAKPHEEAAKPAEAAKPSETQVVSKTPAPAATVTPEAPFVAPELPPATSVAAAPAPKVDPDHPVPPGEIPEVTASASDGNAAPAAHGSRFGWVSHIPLLGVVLDR